MKATWRLNISQVSRYVGRYIFVLAVVASFVASGAVRAQEKKVLREFRGVRIGMKADAVHTALGKPASTADNREEYTFDGDNQITVHYDNGEVKAIQIFYVDASKAPDWGEVVGDAEIEEMANGAKAARKVVSAEKFWVTMYRNQDGSIVRITISRS